MLLSESGCTMRKAEVRDADQILGLLDRSSLPRDGVKDHLEGFLVAEKADGTIAGVIGMEHYGGETALLRSAAVDPMLRSRGIGSALYDALIKLAHAKGVRRMVLLTTSAELYFARKGFQKISRESVTGPVTQSAEFKGACPTSAICMELRLGPRILILCTGNSCRSQMAEALLRHVAPSLQVESAGTRPGKEVHPYAVQVMKEIGIDLSHAHPKSVDQFVGGSFEYVITVCDNARDECPVFIGNVGKRIHMGFPDPAEASGAPGEVLNVFRSVRDQIVAEFRAFAANELGLPLRR